MDLPCMHVLIPSTPPPQFTNVSVSVSYHSVHTYLDYIDRYSFCPPPTSHSVMLKFVDNKTDLSKAMCDFYVLNSLQAVRETLQKQKLHKFEVACLANLAPARPKRLRHSCPAWRDDLMSWN